MSHKTSSIAGASNLTLPAIHEAELLIKSVKRNLRKGQALYFSHGFSIVYKEQTGVVPPPDVDVILVAPKGSGTGRYTRPDRSPESP